MTKDCNCEPEMDNIENAKEIYMEYEIIRKSGATNMFDFKMVKTIASTFELKNLTKFLNGNGIYSYDRLLQAYPDLSKEYGNALQEAYSQEKLSDLYTRINNFIAYL